MIAKIPKNGRLAGFERNERCFFLLSITPWVSSCDVLCVRSLWELFLGMAANEHAPLRKPVLSTAGIAINISVGCAGCPFSPFHLSNAKTYVAQIVGLMRARDIDVR